MTTIITEKIGILSININWLQMYAIHACILYRVRQLKNIRLFIIILRGLSFIIFGFNPRENKANSKRPNRNIKG